MADYSPTTWVENVTKVGPTNMNKLEEGVRVAGKQAVLVPAGSLGSPTDSNAVVWRRASDGALVAFHQVVESGVTPNRGVSAIDKLVAEGTGTGLVSRTYGVGHQNAAGSAEVGARVSVTGQKGGRRAVYAAADPDTGPSVSVLVVDDTGASDFVRAAGTVQDLTGSSAWNTPRQPNTLRATLVYMSLLGAAGTQASIYVGTNNPPTQRILIGGGAGQGSAWLPFTFIVPPGYYYRYTQDTGTPSIGTRVEQTL